MTTTTGSHATQSTAGRARLLMEGQLKTNSKTGDMDLDEDASQMVGFPEEETKAIDFLKDPKSTMTFSRRIGLYLSKFDWYYPSLEEDEESDDDDGKAGGNETNTNEQQQRNSKMQKQKSRRGTETVTEFHNGNFELPRTSTKPSLEKAWAYFEHVTLYRYIVTPKEDKEKSRCTRIMHKCRDKKLEKAEPGEKYDETRLYHPIFTPHSQLGDFGLGLGLYFSTLWATAMVTLVAGIISIYNIIFFASEDYSPSTQNTTANTLLIRGSAVCEATKWVPCPNCSCVAFGSVDDEALGLPLTRCGTDENLNLTFALKNDCDATEWTVGAVNYAAIITVFALIGFLGWYMKREEVMFDEDEQTAQDYSILIQNPPKDANDPDEWFRFFRDRFDGAHVTVCTCAVDNDFLVRTLVERREIIQTIENMLEPGQKMSKLDLAHLAAKTERERTAMGRLIALVAPGLPELFSRLVALDAKVQGLSQLEYPVTNVFITFETEAEQRRVLQTLSVGSLKAYQNDQKVLSIKHMFRGEKVLAVSEPSEPSTIRWQDLNVGFLSKVKVQTLTVFCTIVSIVAVALVVRIVNRTALVGSSIVIAVFNTLFPMFAKFLTHFEAHPSEGDKQTSLFFKIALFRWVNTAIVISLITPFTDTLTLHGGLIPQIYTLFFAEIFTTSAIQLVDPMGHVNRHFLGPRAITQDAMNLKFQGTEFELAERYTDMTKIFFLCVWYCSIFPGAFFLCALSLIVKYYVDRFSLMRSWKRVPQLGTAVSKFSRRYFFSLACVIMAIQSSFYWAGFPFDNICPNDDIDPAYLDGDLLVTPRDGSTSTKYVVSFSESDVDYSFCNQNLFTTDGFTFPFVAKFQPEGLEWMTLDQERVTSVFGWTSVAVIAIVVLKFVWKWKKSIDGLFHGTYKAIGDDQNMPFSEVASRSGYIPQVISPLFSYPLIACNSDNIDPELYDWADPDRPFSFYDLSKDAAKLLEGMEFPEGVGFSQVKHYPPGQVLLDEDEEEAPLETAAPPQTSSSGGILSYFKGYN